MALPNLVPFNPRSTALDNTALAGWDDLHRDMDRLFDSFFGTLPVTRTSAVTGPNLSLDVSETDKAYTIHADLPGFEEKDVDVTLADNILTIKGERKQEDKQEGKTWHRTERSYGSVQRTLQLPADADENGITATMKNGVLQVEIAKSKEAKPSSRKIEIQKA
jgi:HSP20 family protein